ncbi:MAG: pyridoxal phosphate-dependent aminotransferase [Streptosporangiaceae bacterium]|nr:pyridoxal phosphate-dependent aminotransferase [Streptosporangiaceae bacterium]
MTGTLAEGMPVRSSSSHRARNLLGSGLTELFLLARARGAIDLAVGTPSCPQTPGAMIAAAAAALHAGRNQYEDPWGEADLRRQIALSLNTPADPATEITVTVGATEALCVALLATVDPGDEVIVLEPFYENFLGAITLAGGLPRFVPLTPPDWRLDSRALTAAFGPRTRAIVLNTPSNPTGRTLSFEELNEIAEACERWGVTVISDEVYAGLVFDGRVHLSIADIPRMRPYGIVVGSLSKSLAISGWRLGFLRAGPRRTQLLRRVHEVTTNGAAAPLQYGASQAGVLRGDWWDPASELVRCRDRMQRTLRAMGLQCSTPDGGCFLLAGISAVTGAGAPEYVRQLLDERAVLVVPGTGFFADPARGRAYIRVAFNRAPDVLDAADRNLLA